MGFALAADYGDYAFVGQYAYVLYGSRVSFFCGDEGSE